MSVACYTAEGVARRGEMVTCRGGALLSGFDKGWHGDGMTDLLGSTWCASSTCPTSMTYCCGPASGSSSARSVCMSSDLSKRYLLVDNCDSSGDDASEGYALNLNTDHRKGSTCDASDVDEDEGIFQLDEERDMLQKDEEDVDEECSNLLGLQLFDLFTGRGVHDLVPSRYC
mmetsp:Transcript_122068/g.341674  ORF Transcript_122068/g.341674 Transcript_122068/m.341674 type:complete len:172 (+) Transcript_122068:66-581(+)